MTTNRKKRVLSGALLALTLITSGTSQAAVLWSEIAAQVAADTCLRVPPNGTLIIDGDAVFDRLDVQGTVEFQDNGPRSLEVSAVQVSGTFRAGTSIDPFSNDLEIRLIASSGCAAELLLAEILLLPPLIGQPQRIVTLLPLAAGTFPALNSDDERTILVVDDGQLELYGSDPGLTWTTLASTAAAADSQMTLAERTGWSVDDQVVLAPTDFFHDEADEAVLTNLSSISGDEETWDLAALLSYEHYANAADQVPVFGEVGKLNRNIQVFSPTPDIVSGSDDDCTEGAYTGDHLQFNGAEIRVERPNGGSANAILEFIEVYNAGKFDRLGHYPIHFHMLGNAAGARVHGVSVHHSANRGIVVHGSSNVVLSNNVVYDAVGHGYYLEEAPMMATARNRLEKNLALQIHGCPLEEEADPADVQYEDDINSSGFFFSDPRNAFIDNHAAGAFRAGFWYDGGNESNNWNLCGESTLHQNGIHSEALNTALFADTSVYISADVYTESGLATICDGAFVGNTAHSAGQGLWAEKHKDQLVRIVDFTAYKNAKKALELKNHGVTEIVNLQASDNATTLWPATHAFHTAYRPRGLLIDSVIQGESPHRAVISYPNGDPLVPFYGVEVYEGRLDVARTAFYNFDDSDPTEGKRAAFGRHQNFPFYSNNPDNTIEDITFSPNTNPLYFDDPTTDTRTWTSTLTIDAASGFQSVMLHDLSGDIAPAPGQWIVANDDFNVPASGFGVIYDATANAWYVDDTIWTQGQLLVEWCAQWTVAAVALPRCEWFDPVSGEALPARGWNLLNANGDDFDIIDEVRFLDADDCGGFGCSDELDAEHHRPQGNHNIAAANVRSPGRYYVTFYDQTDTQLLSGDPAFADVGAIQLHLRNAPAGSSIQVGVTVPDMPSCVVLYTDIVMSSAGQMAMTQIFSGVPTTSQEWYYNGSGMVYLQLEHATDEQSVLLVFDNTVTCP